MSVLGMSFCEEKSESLNCWLIFCVPQEILIVFGNTSIEYFQVSITITANKNNSYLICIMSTGWAISICLVLMEFLSILISCQSLSLMDDTKFKDSTIQFSMLFSFLLNKMLTDP